MTPAEPFPSQPENPYASPLSDEPAVSSDGSAIEIAGDMGVDEARATVGRNADYYIRQWTGSYIRPGATADVNWPAFFFCGWWLAYRKMFRLVGIYYVALTMIYIAIVVVAAMPWAQGRLGTLGFLGIVLVPACLCGKRGNVWYRTHVALVIAQTRVLEPNSSERLLALHRQGGTSLLAAIGFVPVSIVMWLSGNLIGATIVDLLRIVNRGD